MSLVEIAWAEDGWETCEPEMLPGGSVLRVLPGPSLVGEGSYGVMALVCDEASEILWRESYAACVRSQDQTDNNLIRDQSSQNAGQASFPS